ncbi:MAG: demethoxyubiquinone hydroxylase family protein [Comamonas sp.]
MKTTTFAERVLKVNHSGENGAINIYAAQIMVARFTAPSLVAKLQEFKAHEQEHRSIFWSELQIRGVRRCRSYVLCGAGGFALGFITALFGLRAIAATTAAVERVVLGHLQSQLRSLSGQDDAAAAAISKIVIEETLHLEQSELHIDAGQFWPKLLMPIVALSTESVIWLGMRL